MRHTTTALLAALLAVGATAGCSESKSYDDIVADCATALKDRAKGDKAKPTACEDVKDDHYTELTISQHLKDNGWVDEDGNADMGKILEDATSQP